jgi:hypothetical protein
MATTNYNPFDIPKGGYAAFDATSLRQLIINRLNEQGTFTDQNYVGSNLAAIIDIVAYAYNTLIYYLNRTSSESMFTEAQLYENINRIVKLIDYSPQGAQTSTLSFKCSAINLTQGLYTLPRYSYLLASGNIPFSFNEDITFNKALNNSTEYLQEISEQKLLYQGIYQEYPTYTAAGDDYETIILNPGNYIIDHFNIDVYVKPVLTGKWELFAKTPNLYLEDTGNKKYEIRFNQNQRYEIKFGDNINGYKLQTGDEVAIYYLQSLGDKGVVATNSLQYSANISPQATPGVQTEARPRILDTIRFNQILQDTLQDSYQLINNERTSTLRFINEVGSTDFASAETTNQIRENAPITYRGQYRLVTAKDYEVFLRSNFANLISDVKVYNNNEYIFNYLNYFYNIGINEPDKTTRALFNQVLLADSCNFNNIYLITVPRSSQTLTYLLPVQKELISNALQDNKVLTSEVVFIDPIYMAFSFGIAETINNFDPATEQNQCRLRILKQSTSRRSDTAIKQDIVNIIKNYFSQKQAKMGQIIEVQQLAQNILDVEGVIDFYTVRIDNPDIKIKGLSLFSWNPIYPENDKTITTNNVALLPFQYPYFNNTDTLANNIDVIASNLFR